MLSHNFFANLYYDYRSDSKFTPYVGFGVGFSRVSLDYFNKWTRNHDPEAISTFDDTTATDEEKNLLHRKIRRYDHHRQGQALGYAVRVSGTCRVWIIRSVSR